MHKTISFLSLVFIISTSQAQDTLQTNASDSIFKDIEVMPVFGDCSDAKNDTKYCTSFHLQQFLFTNLRYPKEAKREGKQGTVYVSFTINKKGQVKDVFILKGVTGAMELDREAIRVVQLLPLWQPGMVDGEPVNVRYTIPIRFKLR